MGKPEKTYLIRYRSVIRKLGNIKKMEPREQYLFPLMDGVPFQDLEVAITLCEIAFDNACNDNKKE